MFHKIYDGHTSECFMSWLPEVYKHMVGSGLVVIDTSEIYLKLTINGHFFLPSIIRSYNSLSLLPVNRPMLSCLHLLEKYHALTYASFMFRECHASKGAFAAARPDQ